MIRTPMVLLAGALFAGGCQHAVFGQKSYGPGNVNGTAYTGGAVHGNAEFRDSMSGSDGYATRTMPTDSARVASSNADSAARAEVNSSAAPRTEVSSSADTTSRSETASRDRDDVNRTSPAPAPAPAATPSDTARSQPEPQPQAQPQPEPAAQPQEAARDAAPKGPNGEARDPERVAAANTARYPDDLKPQDDLNATVTLDPQAKTIRIVNHSGQEIIGGKVWVNESFVTPVASLPAGAMLELKADQFYDRDGRMLPSVSDVNRVQLQSVGKLFNLKVQDKAQQPELNK